MPHVALDTLTDRVYEAHSQIQASHRRINPVVELRGGMRTQGIPADVITIDCLATDRRITLILHDEQADVIFYQWITRDQEVGKAFKQIALSELTSDVLFDWMQEYFQ